MNTVFIVLAVILGVVGIIGSIVPGLPGPPISWVGILLMYFFGFYISTVIFMAAILLYLKVPYLHSAIAIVAILALVYFAFGKFLGVRLPVGTVIKALR